MASVHDAHDSLSQDAANSQGLISVTQAKAKKEDKDKIQLTDLIDKTKATKEERDADVDEVGAELDEEEKAGILKTTEPEIYARLALRYEDTGADNDQVFLIDGDSLLHEILLDPLLDWTHGGQFLHVIFALEQYIKRFQEGGRIFRFVFFNCFGAVAWANQPLIQLMRERIIQHLHALGLQANEFDNWWEPEFAEFLERVDPAFVLVGDGAGFGKVQQSTSASAPTSDVSALSTYMSKLSVSTNATPSLPAHEVIRSLSLHLLSHHFRVIRLTELSFAGNAMLGFQLAMAQAYKYQLREKGGYNPHEALLAKSGENAPLYRVDAKKAFDAKLQATFDALPSVKADARLAATAYALTKTLKQADAKSADLSGADFARAALITAFLSRYLALDARALVWENAEAAATAELKYAPLLRAFHANLLIASVGAAKEGVAPSAAELDIFDGRLLAFVLHALQTQKVEHLGWSASMEKALLEVWGAIQKAAGAPAFLPAFALKSLSSSNITDLDEVTLANEARAKVAAARTTAIVPQSAASVSSPSPAGVAPPGGKAVASAAADEDDAPASWEDEDTEDVSAPKKPEPKKAEAEEEIESWEDISDDDEPAKPNEKAADTTAAAAAAAAPSPVLPAAAQPAEAKALVPLTSLDNKFVKETCGPLDARLAANGLLLSADAASQPLSSFAARYTSNKQLDDGMDTIVQPVIPTNKREQRAASRITNYWEKYSQSLVGGRLVLREVVIAAPKIEEGDEDEAEEEKESASTAAKGGKKTGKELAKEKLAAKEAKKGGKPGAGGGKKGKGTTEKESIKDKIRREVEEQQRLKDQKKIQGKINIAASMSSLPNKIAKLDSELEQVGDASAVPALLQLLEWSMEYWKQSKPKAEIEPAIKVFVLLHDIYRRFRQFLSVDDLKKVLTAFVQIGFEDVAMRIGRDFAAQSEGKYTPEQCKVDVKSSAFPATLIGLSYNRFQLEYVGPWMLRNVDSAPDPRVTKFYPDAWQRKLLDVADAHQSALIVAPTSAGKTFISYYVMKNVLAANKTIERSSERGVVVYVAPNKALVNQVSADVYQRYGLVFGTATDDHQDKALTSEVLITVPSMLEKLLLSPNREGWIKKIRWCIFDEVHLISSAGEGSIWERCLSLIRCPFLALSATVGNPADFHGWLSRLDALRGRQVHLIVHETRWSDLEKTMYNPDDPSVPPHNPTDEQLKKFDLRTNAIPASQWASVRVHPCAAVGSDFADSTEFPREISFSPRDSLSLYDALQKYAGSLTPELKADLAALSPDAFFPELLISKARAMEYEARLKKTLTAWLEAGLRKEVGQVMAALTGDLRDRIARMESKAKAGQSCYDVAFIRKHFFSLVLEMYARDQLPGIIFNNDNELCVQLVTDTLEKLEDMESRTLEMETSSEEQRAKLKHKAAALKLLKKKRDEKKKNKQAEEEAREADEFATEVEADTDEYTPDPRFSFIDETEKMDAKTMKYWIQRTLYKTQWKASHPLIRALYRGIGVHHSGLVKQYRDLVETLFRGKHLKLVVATSTLALGVNMPARSVTLCGDSKLLTPLQYRQMSGRAGRRGYDNIGHVVFFAVPPRKIFRLLKSPLNSLRGHYPINTTLSLRMINYYSQATDKKDASAALMPLLREPFFASAWSGTKLLEQINFQYRASLDSLFKRSLISKKGEAYGLSQLATHMHQADPSNFGLVALLQSGYLHDLCKNYDIDKNRVAHELLTLLAHLFYRVPVPAYLTRANFRASSPNLILLPPVKPEVKAVIAAYNEETMAEFTNYIKMFSQMELGKAPAAETDATPASPSASSSSSSSSSRTKQQEGAAKVYEGAYQLPVSGLNFPFAWTKSGVAPSSLMASLDAAKLPVDARSAFVASSGHSDQFTSARDLAETVRNGIFLDSKLIPVVMEDLDTRGNELQLNAYVVDFYTKQHFYSLVTDNRLSDAFAWSLLKNWSLLLANITTALRTLSVDPTNDILVKAFDHLSSTFETYFSGIVNI